MTDAGGDGNRSSVGSSVGSSVDSSTGNEVSGSVHSLVQGRSFDNATINFFGSAPRPPMGVPALLPPSHGLYTDRVAVHERLDRFVERDAGNVGMGDIVMVQLGGVAGVGKSATAVRYLHGRSDRFGGGVYYADLGGGRVGRGVSATEALDGWLVAKGVLPGEVPSGLAARSALFRRVTADAPVAVLVDDPVSAAQVAPLCPTSPGSLVMVTAHHELPGIRTAHGAEFLRLPMLDHAFALELLAGLVGPDRVAAEPEAFRQLAAFSEGHPLMVRVIAAELSRGSWETAEDLVQELADTRGRRQASGRIMASGGDHSVNAALELSIGGLSESGRALLRALAAHPGAEFGPDLVGFLGADFGALADLAESGLVTPLHEPGAPRSRRRWRLHTLVQDYVRREAASEPAATAAAEQEIIGWYLRRAAVADRARSPRWHIGPDFPDEERFESADAAARWLETEQVNLRSAVTAAFDRGDHETVWQLCEALWGLYFWNNAFGDWVDTHLLGIESAMRLGDRAAEARIRLQLGFAYYNQDDLEQASVEFASALPVAEDSGMAKLLAAAIESAGLADLRLGRPRQALDGFDRVLELVELDPEAGPAAVGNVQRHRARALGALGRPAETVAVIADHAIPAYEADGSSGYNLARTLVDLGDLLIAAGRAEEAVEQVQRAVAEFGRLRNPLQGAVALLTLASAYEALGDADTTTNALRRAAEVYEALGSLKAPEVRTRIEALRAATGN